MKDKACRHDCVFSVYGRPTCLQKDQNMKDSMATWDIDHCQMMNACLNVSIYSTPVKHHTSTVANLCHSGQ